MPQQVVRSAEQVLALWQPAALVCDAFFFQAEDGIRDRNVTGVQTCALPISSSRISERYFETMRIPFLAGRGVEERSEERRVGKECRSRWSPYPSKKNEERVTWPVRQVKPENRYRVTRDPARIRSPNHSSCAW